MLSISTLQEKELIEPLSEGGEFKVNDLVVYENTGITYLKKYTTW